MPRVHGSRVLLFVVPWVGKVRLPGRRAGLQIVLVPYFPIFRVDDDTDDDDDLQCRSNQQTEWQLINWPR